MTHEITDTTSMFASDIPDGRGIFRVSGIEKRYGKAEFFVWKVKHKNGDGEQVLMPNMMGPLLRILGCNETEPNKFDWDTDEVLGKQFMATISHEPDRKDPSKIRQKMGEFGAVDDTEIPF